MDGEQQIRLPMFWHCKMCLCNFHDSEEQKGGCSFSSMAPVLVVPPSHSRVHTCASRGLTDRNDATPEVHCYLTATPIYFQSRATVFSLCRIPAGSRSWSLWEVNPDIIFSHCIRAPVGHATDQVHRLISSHLLVLSLWLLRIPHCCSPTLILWLIHSTNISIH